MPKATFTSHQPYLDIDCSSTCSASQDTIAIKTWVSRPNFRYIKSYLIHSDATAKKHSIICLVTDGDVRSVHDDTAMIPFSFNVSKASIIGGPLTIPKGDKLGIIIFNDDASDIDAEVIEAIKEDYETIFLFDAHKPDVNNHALMGAILRAKKNKDIFVPKEGQGGVIISGG